MRNKTTLAFRIKRLTGRGRLLAPTVRESGRNSVMAVWHKLQADRLEPEIWSSCIVLKNLSIVHRGQPMSCDFILEQLMVSSRPLSNVYADILSAYRNGHGTRAFELLYEKVPVKSARHFALILSRIDQIDPGEMVSHMAAFEETFASARVTRGMRRAEWHSVITTMAATATVFALLLNFTVVVVFMDTMRILGHVF